MGRLLTRSSKPTTGAGVQAQRHSGDSFNLQVQAPPSSSPTLNTRSKRPASTGAGSNDKSVDDGRGGRNDAENGFAQWGGYMAAKKQKLDEQFNESGLGLRGSNKMSAKQLFKGDSVHINGYTSPPEPELRGLFTRHGGRYVQYPTADTTFVVATNLSAAKKRMFASKTVKPEWITDSIKAGNRLDPRKYMLYDLNKENKQHTLTQVMKQPAKTKLSPVPAPAPAPVPPAKTANQTSPEMKQFKIKSLIVKVQKLDATSIFSSKSKFRNHTPKAGPSPSPCVVVVKDSESSGLGDSQGPTLSDSGDSQRIDAAIDLLTPQTNTKSEPVNHGKDNVQGSNDSDEVTIIECTPSPPRSRVAKEKSSVRGKEKPVSKNASTSSSSPSRASTRRAAAGTTTTNTSAEHPEVPSAASAAGQNEANTNKTPVSTASASVGARPGFGKMKTAAEEGYLQEFYNNSRLHLISTLKKGRQQNVAEWRANVATHKFPLAEKYRRLAQERSNVGSTDIEIQNSDKILFHIDLDCFFVAVARLSRPHLQNKPVVITHSKGADSKSDIACPSYEARAFGISAGMWLYQAKELCSDVVAIPYEFDEYTRVSKQFYETVASLTLEMEAISCDEMLVNVTSLLQPMTAVTDDGGATPNPLRLAQFLIDEIQASTGITASIGIGTNRLLAKLATRVAKDAKSGRHFMKVVDAQEYIRPLPVRKLHGVGWATAEKLEALGVKTGSDLERLSLQELKREFGDKTGQKLHSVCRGIDDDTINVDAAKAKSISAGCSFGVRFVNMKECERFLKEVTEEAASRAATARCYCNKMTLTLWIARKGYEKETVKPGGHGIADVHTKSQTFKQKTRDSSVLASSTLELARAIMRGVVPPEHVRGVSISLDGLIYDDDLSEKDRKSHQPTLLSQIKKIQSTKPAVAAEETRSADSNTSRVAAAPESATVPGSLKSSSSSSPTPSSPSSEPRGKATTKTKAKPCPKSRSSSAGASVNNVGLGLPKLSHISPSRCMSTSNSNPYADIQELDPSYLAALPDDVRAEVLLEFQKARNLKAIVSTPDSSISGPSSSKAVLKSKSSPVRSFLKRSPIRSKNKSSSSPRKSGQGLKFFPRKQSSGGGSSSDNNLYSYFKAVERAKSRSPSVSPFKRGGFKTSTQKQKPGGADPASLSLSSEENRLIPDSSAEIFVVPESPQPELDQELQRLLETTPTKKSSLEVEKMIMSFNEEMPEGDSNGNGSSKKAARAEASMDNECGQRMLQSTSTGSRPPGSRPSLELDLPRGSSSAAGGSTGAGRSSSKSPRPTTSSRAFARVRNASGTDDPEVQAAILKSYTQSNGLGDGGDGYDFEADESFTGPAAGPSTRADAGTGACVDDNLSIANNLDSDRDDDFDEYDINPDFSDPTFNAQEIELPPLNGEYEIDKVHETIRMGITDRMPSEDDAECLMTYFRDLSSTFLAQTCNSLRFLQALRAELTRKGGEGAVAWSSIFDTIIKQTQEWIQEDYGGLFEV